MEPGSLKPISQAFYDDFIFFPEDIQLFTDAAPSIGFEGFYQKEWFAGGRPSEFRSFKNSDQYSALFEMYPIILSSLGFLVS